MATIKELKGFYLRNKHKFPREKQNKINYLFRILKSSFGDTAHVYEVQEHLQEITEEVDTSGFQEAKFTKDFPFNII